MVICNPVIIEKSVTQKCTHTVWKFNAMMKYNYYTLSFFLFFSLASTLHLSLSIHRSLLNEPTKSCKWCFFCYLKIFENLWSGLMWTTMTMKKYSTCNKPLLRFDKFSNWNLMEMDSSDLQKTMCWWYCKSSNGFPHYSFILYLNLNLFTYVTYSIYLIVPNLSSNCQQQS